MSRRLTDVETGHARIRELEALLAEAYGVIDSGPATAMSRAHILAKIAKALGWPRIPVEQLIADLVAWGTHS